MKKIFALLLALVMVSVMVLSGCRSDDVQVMDEGDTNFTNLVTSGYVTVGTDIAIGDTLDVNGDIDLDGDGFDVDVTGAISLDADSASNLSTSSGDITIDGEAGSVTIIGSEAAADSITLDANDTVTSGLNIDIGSVSGMTIDGGLLDVGGGTCGVADGDNDVCIKGVLEVDDEFELDGALDADSTSNFADTATFSKGSGTALDVSSGGELNNDGTLDQNGTSNFGAAVTCSYAGNCLTSATTADIEWLGFAAFGDATPDGVTDGTAEAVFIEGGLEVNGTIYADGAIDADSTSDFAGTATFSKGSGDALSVSAGAALNNEGTLDQNGTSDFADTATFSKGSGNAIVISAGGSLSLPATADIAAYGYTAVGNGTPNGDVTAGTDEQLYVEGNAEFDGILNADGAVNADSTLDVAGTVTFAGLWLPGFANETITNGELLTPTVTVYALDSGGNVTVTLAASAIEGQPLTLICDNDGNTIVIADTNIRTSDGNKISMGDYDVCKFVYQDSEWLLEGCSTNS